MIIETRITLERGLIITMVEVREVLTQEFEVVAASVENLQKKMRVDYKIVLERANA